MPFVVTLLMILEKKAIVARRTILPIKMKSVHHFKTFHYFLLFNGSYLSSPSVARVANNKRNTPQGPYEVII